MASSSAASNNTATHTSNNANATTASSSPPTLLDHYCAQLARSALFPSRYHYNNVDSALAPAWRVLDQIRQDMLTTTAVSKLFPRHVVVVRDLSQQNDNVIQWNGQPDLNPDGVSMEIIPNVLSVKCVSSEHQSSAPSKQQESAVKVIQQNNGDTTKLYEVVLCSNCLLKKSSVSSEPQVIANQTQSDNKEASTKHLHIVEEALARGLVLFQYMQKYDTASGGTSLGSGRMKNDLDLQAQIQVAAAQAAECYFYENGRANNSNDKQQESVVRKGSHLQSGYSWMPRVMQDYFMHKCIFATSFQHLIMQQQHTTTTTAADVRQAIRRAIAKQQSGSGL